MVALFEQFVVKSLQEPSRSTYSQLLLRKWQLQNVRTQETKRKKREKTLEIAIYGRKELWDYRFQESIQNGSQKVGPFESNKTTLANLDMGHPPEIYS